MLKHFLHILTYTHTHFVPIEENLLFNKETSFFSCYSCHTFEKDFRLCFDQTYDQRLSSLSSCSKKELSQLHIFSSQN